MSHQLTPKAEEEYPILVSWWMLIDKQWYYRERPVYDFSEGLTVPLPYPGTVTLVLFKMPQTQWQVFEL